MKTKVDFAYLIIAVEVGDEYTASEAVGDWLQRLPPEHAGRQTHGFVGMVMTDGPPDANDVTEVHNRYSAWYRDSGKVLN